MFSYTETSQSICEANQLTGFYMMGTLLVRGLNQKGTVIGPLGATGFF